MLPPAYKPRRCRPALVPLLIAPLLLALVAFNAFTVASARARQPHEQPRRQHEPAGPARAMPATRSPPAVQMPAPAAPAPMVTKKILINELFKGIEFGAVNNPTAHVNITKDITLGFINNTNDFKYDEILKKYDQVLVITLTKGLSGMNNSMRLAADEDKYKGKVFVPESKLNGPVI